MRSGRYVIPVLVVVGACAGGVAAGSAVAPDAAPRTSGDEAVQARPGSASIGARAPDPGGGPGWAVRRYSSQGGLECTEAGRYDGERFGRSRSDGEVEQQPADEAGTCAVRGSEPVEPVINRYPVSDGTDDRTVLFGQTRQDIDRIDVRVDGRRLELVPANDGTFLLVLEGLREPASLPLTATLRDGSVRRYDWR